MGSVITWFILLLMSIATLSDGPQLALFGVIPIPPFLMLIISILGLLSSLNSLTGPDSRKLSPEEKNQRRRGFDAREESSRRFEQKRRERQERKPFKYNY